MQVIKAMPKLFILAVPLLMVVILFLALASSEQTAVINSNQKMDKVSEIVFSIKILLKEINIPLRLNCMVCWEQEFSHLFLRQFQTNNNNNDDEEIRDYMIGIMKNDFHQFPFYLLDEHYEMIIIDLNCRGDNLLDILNHTRSQLKLNFKWLFINSDFQLIEQMDEEIGDLMANLPILPRSEIYYIGKNNQNEFIFKQVYRTAMSEPLIFELYGIYGNGTFQDYGREKTIVSRRKNLMGIELRACMVVTNNDSLNHLDDYKNKHVDTITKCSYILTNHVIDYINATISYSVVNSWGYLNKDTGRWDGMIGQLVDNQADIGATPLFFTSDRTVIIQYIAMPSSTGSKFIFRAPKLSYTDNVFLLPFDDLVWMCLLALVFVTAMLLTAAIFVEWKLPLVKPDETDAGLLQPSIGDVFLLIYGATCQQGSAVAPKSTTARVIMVVAFVILMFLYTSYSANIVALLQSPSKKIRTLKDLYDSRLKLGVDDTVYNHYYFTHQTEPLRRAIYENKVKNKDGSMNFINFREGIKRVRDGLYAFHVERSVGYQLISETFFEDEKCGLQGIEFFQMIDPWYAIQKNSSYQELLKSGMMRINEHGLQDRENSKLYTKEPKCTGAGGHFVTASLVDTGPAMLVLVWGFSMALLLLFIEIECNRIKSGNSLFSKIKFRK